MVKNGYLNNLIFFVKKNGVKAFFIYQWLKLRIIFGCKTFKLNLSSNVCTKDKTLTIGKEYQYSESCILERAIVEKICFKKFFLHVDLYFIDSNRHIKVSHIMAPIGYMGMWKICDKDFYDIELFRSEGVKCMSKFSYLYKEDNNLLKQKYL
ncbi:MAG: hypothetical protein WBJ36_08805 [Tenuifilum sp.]|jgi:hypothetical protein|uniref:hypothetical protein n=1 Tax=Tenuifilum sp. TaxID=2760880 RepID=UPI002C576C7C|nr:hypothetical protein [Tenuifilum sp.]HQG72646.1 hypothetical protein [Tenuifilum sp.]HQK41574.1 hypothetical protein [bacterium]HRR11511.1 hypothetical protein [Tenuifilum sp.]